MSKFILGIANSIANLFESSPHGAGESSLDGNYPEYLSNVDPSPEELKAHGEQIMDVMPLISVIVIASKVNNDALANSLNSLKAQSYKNIETIIVSSSILKILDDWRNNKSFRFIMIDGNEKDMIELGVKKSTGEFLLFLKPGDILNADMFYRIALKLNECNGALELIYTDEDTLVDGKRGAPLFKPDFSPNTLCSMDYIGRAFAVKKTLYESVGGLNSMSLEDFYDFSLRAAFKSIRNSHVPYVGYTKSSYEPALNQQKVRAILDSHLKREHQRGHSVSGLYEGSFRLHYTISKKSDIAIMVVCYGDTDALRQCLEHIEDNSTYDNYSITVVNMGLFDSRLRRYLNALKNTKAAAIQSFPPNTSRAKALNVCAQKTYARALMFLDYRVLPLSADWMESMMEYALLESTGAVGAKLVTPDYRIMHSGYVVGLCGWWQSPFFGERDGYCSSTFNQYVNTIRNVTALSANCMMINANSFNDIGGFDESFIHSGEDVDLCIRLMRKQRLNVYTPYAKMMLMDKDYTRPSVADEDNIRCYDTCRKILLCGDPYYNPAYDYANTHPTIASKPYPAIALNPNFT